VAPRDGLAERLLAPREITRAIRKDIERLPGPVPGGRRRPAELLEDRDRRQQPDARRGQLDRQRQPVQPRADLRNCQSVLVRQGEVRADRPRPLDEQPDGGDAGQRLKRLGYARIREPERRQRGRAP